MTPEIYQLVYSLECMHPLRAAPLRAAISALHPLPGSRGLDIGCGIGDLDLMLAEVVTPGGHITGLDISLSLLDCACRKAGQSGFADCLTFVHGEMQALPFAPASFDWAWSVDCVGYPSADLLPILTGIRRVVHPGGVIALLAWSSQQLLPGYSMLEARLNANRSAYAPFLEHQLPQSHFQRALHWFPLAGLTDVACTTFIGQVHSPVRPEIRIALALLFEQLWGDAISQASRADLEEYRRLCSAASADFIVDLPEYYAFFTYTMFTGRVAVVL